MRCPSLADLPAPPPERTGWPWTEESRRLPENMGGNGSWPKLTIVTPSFNQGRFVEETLRSVLLQGYPNLEYFVLDGGSTDETVEIINRYSRWLDFWVSERDGGQSAAINRGLRMGSGSYATWINSDDMLCKNALHEHCLTHGLAGNVVYVGDCIDIDQTGKVLGAHRGRVRTFEDLVRVRSVWQSDGYISQQEVLFPLRLAVDVGGLNEANHYSMDYELWGEFLLAGASVQYTGIPFGYFRRHEAQKTRESQIQVDSTLDAAEALIARADSLASDLKRDLLADLRAYRREYPEIVWRHTGRLSRFGLPRSIVIPIRRVKEMIGAAVEKLTGI